MDHAINVHRLNFAFTATFHYLFPQLTMGLAPLIVYLKTQALRTADDHYNRAARFWTRIFAINFTLGVVTGIPMEFQFGTDLKQMGLVAVRTHDVGCGANGLFCHGRNRCFLSADGQR